MYCFPVVFSQAASLKQKQSWRSSSDEAWNWSKERGEEDDAILESDKIISLRVDNWIFCGSETDRIEARREVKRTTPKVPPTSKIKAWNSREVENKMQQINYLVARNDFSNKPAPPADTTPDAQHHQQTLPQMLRPCFRLLGM
jgi:hypothetical protein